MIIARAPMRINFIGGGTDLPEFYTQAPGRVLSAAIDKYVYIVLNRTPLVPKVSARYSISETVDNLKDLKHTRIKAALQDLGIHSGIEIASFAPLPAKTGLGSSSSFSVALMKALHAYQGKKLDPHEAAQAAFRLESELVGDLVGKQDPYAAALGGLNVMHFHPDHTVQVDPVYLDYRKRLGLEDHLMLFFTGIPVAAGSTKKVPFTSENIKSLTESTKAVDTFKDKLVRGDFKGLGQMLHDWWAKKRQHVPTANGPALDQYYQAGKDNGAWGGKLLGPGPSGSMMFLVPPEHKAQVRAAVQKVAARNGLKEFKEIPIKFVQSGAEIIFNGDNYEGSLQL